MGLYKFYHRTKRGDTVAGVIKAPTETDARLIAKRHLNCRGEEININPVELEIDGYGEVYYGG